MPGEHAPDPVAWAKLGLCPYRGTFLSVRKLASTEKHPCIEQMCANTMNSEAFQEWIRLAVFLYKHSALYKILKKLMCKHGNFLRSKAWVQGRRAGGGVQSRYSYLWFMKLKRSAATCKSMIMTGFKDMLSNERRFHQHVKERESKSATSGLVGLIEISAVVILHSNLNTKSSK